MIIFDSLIKKLFGDYLKVFIILINFSKINSGLAATSALTPLKSQKY